MGTAFCSHGNEKHKRAQTASVDKLRGHIRVHRRKMMSILVELNGNQQGTSGRRKLCSNLKSDH